MADGGQRVQSCALAVVHGDRKEALTVLPELAGLASDRCRCLRAARDAAVCSASDSRGQRHTSTTA